MAKGQVEFVVIIGIIVVATVAVIYAYQSGIFTGSEVPAAVQQKYDSVKASFESLVRDGVQDTMRKLSMYGGYLDNQSFQMGSVTYLGKEVPYWQLNGQVKYPNVQDNFRRGLSDYVSRSKDSMLQSLKMNGVTLGEPQVSVSFLTNKAVINVNMPTTIDGNKINRPYIIDVQTRLAEIDEFARAFASYEKEKRPLEYYTLSSMILSPIEQDVHSVPVFIFLADCGSYVFKGWWDVKPKMEYVIKTTLANTFMPGKAKTHIDEAKTHPQYTPEEFQRLSGCTTETCVNGAVNKGTPFISKEIISPQYMLVPLNGKRYESLDVNFDLPDSFELTQSNFQFFPDPITATANVIPLVGECLSDPVYVSYYTSYPAIVRVKDPLTQNIFQFAVHVYIKDNQPGDWKSLQGYQSEAQAQICSNMQCFADISLKDSSNRPIDYASVSFMGCELGVTNSQGTLRALAPCGIGPIQVFKHGFDSYSKMESSDNLRSLSITLVKKPAVNLRFYEVRVDNNSVSRTYTVSAENVGVIGSDQNVNMNFYDMVRNTSYQRTFNTRGGQLSELPAGNYMIGGSLLSKSKELGTFVTYYLLSEGLDGKDLFIYIPTSLEYEGMTDNGEKIVAATAMTNVLTKCGLGPISLSEAKDFKGCTVNHNEV